MSTENLKWQSYFLALQKVRSNQKAHAAPMVGILLLGLIAFVILSLAIGFQVAIVTFVVASFLFLNFGLKIKGISQWIQQRSRIDAQSAAVERRILSAVAQELAPWLRVRFESAPIAEPLKNSKLIADRIDFVHASRCLTGVFQNEIGFCLSYANVGKNEIYVDFKKRKQTNQKIHFQGLFMILDFPTHDQEQVLVESDRLESLGWMAHEWRSMNDSKYLRMDNPDFERYFHVKATDSVIGFKTLSPETQERLVAFKDQHPDLPCAMSFKNNSLMIVFPMKKDPFVLRDNSELWENELLEFKSTASLTVQFLEALCLNNISERSEAV